MMPIREAESTPGMTATETLFTDTKPIQAETAAQRTALTIEQASRWPRIDIQELWSYRNLFLFLAWRDVKVRYAQTLLGAGWAVLQPTLTMVIFTLIFGRVAHLPSDGVSYLVFVLAGLVPWTYFSTALTGASNSLVMSTNLLTKIYFPRIVIPSAPVLASLVDYIIGLCLVLVVVFAHGIVPRASSLFVVPFVSVTMILAALGVGCWLAALNLQYRDVKYAVPFLLQVWMYTSPVVYSVSLIPARFRIVYSLNPLVGVVEGFRASLLGTRPLEWSLIVTSFLSASVLFLGGALYFRRTERIFADVA